MAVTASIGLVAVRGSGVGDATTESVVVAAAATGSLAGVTSGCCLANMPPNHPPDLATDELAKPRLDGSSAFVGLLGGVGGAFHVGEWNKACLRNGSCTQSRLVL